MSRINFPMNDIDLSSISSASQLVKAYKKADERHQAQTQVYQSQIDMVHITTLQQKEIAELSSTISDLLKLNQLQVKQNEVREKLETRRFWINAVLAFVAAITGVVALFN